MEESLPEFIARGVDFETQLGAILEKMNYTRKFGLPLWNNEEGGVVSQYYFDTSSRPGHSLLYGQVTFYGLPAEVAKVAEKLDDELPKITEEWDI